MKLKQFLSTALALVMVLSLSIPVFAADYSTAVSYDGTGTEKYELTVPSQLKPGTSGNVTLSGTWASNRHIAVTADKTVAMTGSLGGSETLDITFAGIDLTGDNEAAVSETKPVSVASLDALFGTWTGVFYYNVGAADVGSTTVNPDSGSSSNPDGGSTGVDSEGDSSSSDPLEGVDLSQAVAFTITQENRAAVGYTGEENENLVIPAYFVGDGENGTTEGQVYKVTGIADGSRDYNGAFYKCTNLNSVTLPSSVTSIGDYAFRNCDSLNSVVIPDSVTSIGTSAFYGCKDLTSVTIPSSVTSIGDYAFRNCDSLNSVVIPDSVTTIGNYAFNGCDRLESVVIFGGITIVDKFTFGSCPNLVRVSIPESVTSIGNAAFISCDSLTSIIIPESVKTLGWQVFYDCHGLTSITIPAGVTSIGNQTFNGCDSLTSINVDADNSNYCSNNGVLFNKDKTTLIKYPAGKSETSYTIPNSVTHIKNWAFSSCSKLTSVTIPNSVTSIGDYVFDDSGLTTITFDGTQEQWEAITKGSNPGSYTIYCTDGNISK